MDNLTHTLVGAVTAQAFFKKKVGPEAVPVLCWASNLPDIDALVMLKHDPAAITLRRTFGHSVFLFPLWSLGLAWVFKRLYPNQKFSTLYLLCLLGSSLHVFFDLINSFGVVALWPFSLYRPELAIVFIIDLLLLAFLAAPFLLTRAVPSWRGKLRQACRASAAVVCAYILFCAGARLQAEVRLMRQAAGLTPDFTYVFPEPLGPHRWRGVVRFGDEYRLYLIRTFGGGAGLWGIERTDENTPAVEAVKRASPMARRLLEFFKAPVWTVRRSPDGAGTLVTVYDLRFRSLVFPKRKSFTYAFVVRPDGAVEERGRL
jgi:inner membrane protein